MQRCTNPYRLDKNVNSKGLLLFVREDIPSKKIDHVDFDTGFDRMLIEFNIMNTKWLINCLYNPHKADIKKHLKITAKNIDLRSSKIDNFIV